MKIYRLLHSLLALSVITILPPGIVSAQNGFPVAPFLAVEGPTDGEGFGASAVCRGGDALVGVPRRDQGNFTAVGVAELYQPANSTSPILELLRPSSADTNSGGFGKLVGAVGDVSGDGNPDYFVAGPGSNFFGGVFFYSNLAAPSIAQIFGSQSFGEFGSAVASVGDLNADGRAEVLIGAPGQSGGNGAIEVWDVFNNTRVHRRDGISTGGRLGDSVAGIGDIDGDTVPDFVVGVPGDPSSGAALVISGSDFQPIAVLAGGSGDQRFGSVSVNLGDLNGDGIAELAVGAPGTNTAGSVLIYSGASLSTSPVLLCSLGAASESFGSAIAGVGDVSHDGIDDFAVGAPSANAGIGEVQFFTYSIANGCTQIGILQGSVANQQFGVSIAGTSPFGVCLLVPGDTNDFVISSTGSVSSTQRGQVTFYRVTTPTPTPTATPTATPTPTPSPTPTPDAPAASAAELAVTLTSRGSFNAVVSYNHPATECDVSLYARAYVNGQRYPIRTIGRRVLNQANRVSWSAQRMPRALKVGGNRPMALLIARTRCATKTFFTNIGARYMSCGVGEGVSLDRWTAALQAKAVSSVARIR